MRPILFGEVSRTVFFNVNGSTVNGTKATYTIPAIAASHTVTVEFISVYAVNFSVTASGNGTLSATVDGSAVTSPANVEEG